MTITEAIVSVILSHSVWTMDAETGKPTLCVPKSLEENSEMVCTAVPDIYLQQWLIDNSTKV